MKGSRILPDALWRSSLAPVLLVGLLVSSVAKAAPVEDDYVPLGVGMEWIMDLTSTSAAGETSNGVYHLKIVATVEHDGKTWFRSHTWLEGGRPFVMDYTKLSRKDANWFYVIDERDTNQAVKLSVKLPLTVGSKWDSQVDGGTLHKSVLGKGSVTVGKTVYTNCFHVRIASEPAGYTEEFWVAPGVGGVKSEIKTAERTLVLTLREFKQPDK